MTLGIGFLALLLAVPILSIVWETFSPEPWPGTLWLYIRNTFLLMVCVGGLAMVMGVTCAWLISAYEFPGRAWLSWALILPIAAPAYIIAYVYTDILDYFGPVQSLLRAVFGWQVGEYGFPSMRNLPGAALVLSLVLYPYVYILARTAFLRQSQSQWWAARNLGLGPRQAFFQTALPSARPAIAGGLALVLMETLADFGVSDFLAVPTFSVGIFRNWLIIGDRPAAMKLASVMLLAVIILVVLETSTRKGKVSSAGRTFADLERAKLHGPRAALATSLCLSPVLFGLLIPILHLILLSITQGDQMGVGTLAAYAGNSVVLALIVSLITLALALIFAYVKRQRPNRARKGAIRIATLGYALPGTLLAVGLLSPLSAIDQQISKTLSSTFGWSGGLILTGTIIALTYALSVRFLTVSYNNLEAGFEKIPPAMDHVARSLGAGFIERQRRIFLPLLRPSLISAAVLVFIDVVRELPATLIMRPFNFDTLATRVYWLASDERLSEASTAALIIILVSVVPTLLLNHVLVKSTR